MGPEKYLWLPVCELAQLRLRTCAQARATRESRIYPTLTLPPPLDVPLKSQIHAGLVQHYPVHLSAWWIGVAYLQRI